MGLYRDVLFVSDQEIITLVAGEKISAPESDQHIGTVPTMEAVVAVVSGIDVRIPIKRIVSGTADEHIMPTGAVQPIRAITPVQSVIAMEGGIELARVAVKLVITRPTLQRIIASIPGQQVIAAAAIELISAVMVRFHRRIVTIQTIVAVIPKQCVGAPLAQELIIALATGEIIIAMFG
ncbi:MAG: hypothetical protein WA970_10270, partial [Gammaproteobacteria bacterium]